MKLSFVLKKAIKKPTVVGLMTAVAALGCSVLSGVLFVVIAASEIPAVVTVLCVCVLVLLPAFCCKSLAVAAGLRSRKKLFAIAAAAYTLSVYPVCCTFVSHDYQLSVYRYMKNTQADVYYFGGLDGIRRDYLSIEDYMQQMKQAPASIVLQNMTEEELSRLTADELKSINEQSLWDYCDFDSILGGDAEEVAESMELAAETNAYDFTFKHRGLIRKNTAYFLTDPTALFSELYGLFKNGSHSVNPPTFAFFVAAQLISLYMICLHFDVDGAGQLIYIYKRRTAADTNTDVSKTLEMTKK